MKFTSNKGELTLNKTPNITLARFDSETYRKWNRILASISCILIFLLLLGIVLRSIWNERHNDISSCSSVLQISNSQSNCKLSLYEQNKKCQIECSMIQNFNELNVLLNNPTEEMLTCMINIRIKSSRYLNIIQDWLPSENNILHLDQIEFLDCDINIIDTHSFGGVLFTLLTILTFQTTNIKLIKSNSLDTQRLEQLNFRDTHLIAIEQGYSHQFNVLHTLQYVRYLNNPEILENITMYTKYPRLMTLDIRFSDDLILKKEMFNHLNRLELLTLQDGNIRSIEPKTFTSNKQLRRLNLSNTKLSYISENIFGDYPYMSEFDISQNPWFCNCSLQWLKNTWMTYESQSNVPICNEPDIYHGYAFNNVEFCTGEIVTTENPSTTTTDNNENDNEIFTMPCLNNGEIHVGEQNFQTTTYKDYKHRDMIDFNVFESNGDVIVVLNKTLDDYCILWTNNERELIIDDNLIISDKQNTTGCFTKINQTTSIMKLTPENLYTICLIHANETLISPFDCKAIKISFYNDDNIINRHYMLWVIVLVIIVSVVILLSLITFVVYRRNCLTQKCNTKHMNQFNQIVNHDDAFNAHVQWPFPTNNIDTVSNALNKSTTFSLTHSQYRGERRLARSLSETNFSEKSYQTFCSGDTGSYVKPPEPSALELLNWKMTCMREKYFKEQQSPPPLPPYPLQKSNTTLPRTHGYGTSSTMYNYHM